MAAVDKTIFECPVYTLYTQLDGAQRIIIQPSAGAAQDYGVPLSLLSQWLFSTYNIGVFGGSANPDPANGNNGDLYFQNNGKIYQKVTGGWVLKATIPTLQSGDAVTITSGTPVTGGNYTLTYAPYLAVHGSNPSLELDWKNPDTGNWDVQYTGITKIFTGSTLTSLVLFLNNDGSATVGDYKLIIR